MQKSQNEKNFYWSSKSADSGGSTMLTVINQLDGSAAPKFTSKNIFRINKSSTDERKIYFAPAGSNGQCGVKIYIKNENNITNYNSSRPKTVRRSSDSSVEPIIMPSFNRNRPSEFRCFKRPANGGSDTMGRAFPTSPAQRAMNSLKKVTITPLLDLDY